MIGRYLHFAKKIDNHPHWHHTFKDKVIIVIITTIIVIIVMMGVYFQTGQLLPLGGEKEQKAFASSLDG